jgi:adenylate cyclase
VNANNRKNRLFILSAILIVAAVVSIAAGDLLPVVRVAENWAQDLRVATLSRAQPQSREIVVVTVSEETLTALPYRSPLDRRFLSALLRSLEAKAARLIAVDVLLDQPSEPDKDRELQETLRNLSVPIVMASADTSDGLTRRQSAFMASYLNGIRKGIPTLSVDSIDGTVRAMVLRRRHDGQTQLGFTAAIVDALGMRVPAGDSLRLRYRGVPDANTPPFATYPAHALALLPDAWFAGRIVLVGADLKLTDRHRTPFSVLPDLQTGGMPGVVLLAHGLSQIIDGDDGPDSPKWQSSLMIAAFAMIGILVVLSNLSLAVKALALLLASGVIWVGGAMIFQYTGQLIPLVTPTLALALAAALSYAWQHHEEQARRRFIHGAFSKYVAPTIVEHLIEHPEKLRLGGERRNLTFLFTDIADYTTLTENTEASLLVTIMNEYFDGACAIILEHGGTIEKFVGDALHVMFNAPLDQPDHQQRAVACALALDAFCQAFAARQRTRKIKFGVTRIGVNTGVTVVGNFGGANRFDYSATGDAINTAARLESVNKQTGTRVCVSGTTIEHCNGVAHRPVGELILKGKSEPVAAFEPVSGGDRSYANIEAYLAAYQLMANGDPGAEHAFRKLSETYPEDGLIRFHLERLAAGESGSVVVMKEK